MAENQFSLEQEHDIQYNLVHKRLSDLIEAAPTSVVKEMALSALRAWEEAVSEDSEKGEAFALYGFPSKKVAYELVLERDIHKHEGRNPQPVTYETGPLAGRDDLYSIEVDQDPFEIAISDDFYSVPSPLNTALWQAYQVTGERFFTEDGKVKQPDNPECLRIRDGLLAATRARYVREEMDEWEE